MHERLLLGYYGDDFTGSTDALEALSLAGVRTVLFVERPTQRDLERLGGLQAIGLAGMSRTMTPEEMNARLVPDFELLKAVGPAVVHYKTCSTFDSAPEVGSIGRAIDLGRGVFGGAFVPLLVGAPRLGRYCAFGNLFARSGLDSPIYRLDRHPTMSRHPVTPMGEADLRLHLGRQTKAEIALFDLLSYGAPGDEIDRRLQRLLEPNPEVVLFDAVYQEHLQTVGRLVWERTSADSSLFVVGSSGMDYALAGHWQGMGIDPPPPDKFSLESRDQLVVVSGSCSPVAAAQISHAVESGFAELSLDTPRLFGDSNGVCEDVVRSTLGLLRDGRSVVIHTCLGPDDPRIHATASRSDDGQATAILGQSLGRMLRRVLEESGLRRAIVAGGDTSGHVAHELGISALEMAAQLAPGTPLCRVHAPGRPVHGLEIAFKGGQTGKVDFYDAVLRGDERRLHAGV